MVKSNLSINFYHIGTSREGYLKSFIPGLTMEKYCPKCKYRIKLDVN